MQPVTDSLKQVLEASKGLQPQLRFSIVFGVLVVVAGAAFAPVGVGTQWAWVSHTRYTRAFGTDDTQ